MNNESKSLKTVFLKVLENWAMMLVDEIETTEDPFVEVPLYASRVKVDGQFHGVITIVANKEFLQNLATNLLGSSEPITDEESIRDAFREMGNVMAGNFLTEAYGTGQVFNILQPEVVEIQKEDLEKLMELPNAYFVNADENPTFVSFNINE